MENAVTFPGLPAIVPSARRFVRGLLAGSPRGGDMELIASELVTNAILHTPSGDPDGQFTVRVLTGTGWARVEVSDTGTGHWHPGEAVRSDDEYGRGLAIVASLADKFGHDASPEGQTLWARSPTGTNRASMIRRQSGDRPGSRHYRRGLRPHGQLRRHAQAHHAVPRTAANVMASRLLTRRLGQRRHAVIGKPLLPARQAHVQ